ncbi:19952_t:CDS:2, partial [Gigaspora margarita]
LKAQVDALNHVLNSQNVYTVGPYFQKGYSDVDIDDSCEDHDNETNEPCEWSNDVNSGPVIRNLEKYGKNEENPGEDGSGDGCGDSNDDINIDPKLEISSQYAGYPINIKGIYNYSTKKSRTGDDILDIGIHRKCIQNGESQYGQLYLISEAKGFCITITQVLG